jgi:hypothetical protein
MENTPQAQDHIHNEHADTTERAETERKAFVRPRVERHDDLLDVTGFDFPAGS